MAIFSTEAVRRLTEGSFERLIARLEEAVSDSPFFDEGATVLGTFKDHALVATDSGQCAKVTYSDADGDVRIESVEEVDLPYYDDSDLLDLMEEEAGGAVKLWRAGRKEEAASRIRMLATLAERWDPRTENRSLRSWVGSLAQPRPWLTIFTEKSDLIEGALGESALSSGNAALEALRVESRSDKNLDEYRGLVVKKMEELHGLTARLVVELGEDIDRLSGVASALKDRSEVVSLAAFAEDLLEDLSRLDRMASESPKHIKRVEHLGRLHDLMATRLVKAGVARNFVKTMSDRLEGDTPLGGESNA